MWWSSASTCDWPTTVSQLVRQACRSEGVGFSGSRPLVVVRAGMVLGKLIPRHPSSPLRVSTVLGLRSAIQLLEGGCCLPACLCARRARAAEVK